MMACLANKVQRHRRVWPSLRRSGGRSRVRLHGLAGDPASALETQPPLTLTESEAAITITGGSFILGFDKGAGRLSQWQIAGTELLESGPILNLWRAPTDNDGIKLPIAGHAGSDQLQRWLELGLNELNIQQDEISVAQPHPGQVVITVLTRADARDRPGAFIHQQRYTIFGSGGVFLENVVGVDLRPADTLPRVGVTLAMPPEFEAVEWYGRGPHESYADRKAGAAVGLFRGTVTGQYVPYIMPQEHGNKTDVRWLALISAAGLGLKFTAQPLMEASVSHFTANDLYQALHTHELTPRPEVFVNLDTAQAGLGNASCGPETLPQYRLGSGTYRFDFWLQPFTN